MIFVISNSAHRAMSKAGKFTDFRSRGMHLTQLHDHLEQLRQDMTGTFNVAIERSKKIPAENLRHLLASFEDLRTKILDLGSVKEMNERVKAIEQQQLDLAESQRATHIAIQQATIPKLLPRGKSSNSNNINNTFADQTNARDPTRIAVKLEKGTAANFKLAKNPQHILNRVNACLEHSSNARIQEINIAACKQLKNGDLEIYTDEADDAITLTIHAEDWDEPDWRHRHARSSAASQTKNRGGKQGASKHDAPQRRHKRHRLAQPPKQKEANHIHHPRIPRGEASK